MRRAMLLGVAALVVAGCADDSGGGVAQSATPTAASRTAAPSTTARPTRPAPPPTTVDAPCPYADAQTVAETVGQRISRITVTQTRPYVGCGYYRGNGEKAVDIAVSVLEDPAAAQARAIALPGQSANPVDGIGDGGAVVVTDTGSVLAVSKGRALVVVRINQRVSLEAVEIAKLVVARL